MRRRFRAKDVAGALVRGNPQLKWADTGSRGYMTVNLTQEKATSHWHKLRTIRERSRGCLPAPTASASLPGRKTISNRLLGWSRARQADSGSLPFVDTDLSPAEKLCGAAGALLGCCPWSPPAIVRRWQRLPARCGPI